MPLADEAFLADWEESSGPAVLDFLKEKMKLPAQRWLWKDKKALEITFVQTLGGRLPVISTNSHWDFRQMEAILNGREGLLDLPVTVNAFTLQARAESIYCHRVLLLNKAPYSNVAAEKIGLTEADWLKKSQRLRLRHECAHYETLRLLGGMQNHAQDEILADALGQLAAFGDFSAPRQRLFFGLRPGQGTCTGRLAFYCQKLPPAEQEKVYRKVDKALDIWENRIKALQQQKAPELEIFAALAGESLNTLNI